MHTTPGERKKTTVKRVLCGAQGQLPAKSIAKAFGQ